MLIVGRASIERFTRKHAASRAPMARWIEIASAAVWRSIVDARQSFPSADAIKGTSLTCFNIGGNSYRLLAIVSYKQQEVLIRELVTHAEYTRKYLR